jgi:hypothetical protein
VPVEIPARLNQSVELFARKLREELLDAIGHGHARIIGVLGYGS